MHCIGKYHYFFFFFIIGTPKTVYIASLASECRRPRDLYYNIETIQNIHFIIIVYAIHVIRSKTPHVEINQLCRGIRIIYLKVTND